MGDGPIIKEPFFVVIMGSIGREVKILGVRIMGVTLVLYFARKPSFLGPNDQS